MNFNSKFIQGRKLTIDEIKKLADGTMVWCVERDEWKRGGEWKDELKVFKEGELKGEKGSYYVVGDDLLIRDTGLDSVYEVCILDEVQEVTIEQVKKLPVGTKVFVEDKNFYDIDGQWATLFNEGLDCGDETRYSFDVFNRSKQGEYSGRPIKFYVDKSIKLEEDNMFKVGDRVKHVKFGLGTVKEISTCKDYTVEFDVANKGYLHRASGVCQQWRGYWCDEEDLSLVVELAEAETKGVTFRTSGKTTLASFNGISAIANCHPDDDFIEEIGQSIALRRLADKLEKIGNDKLAKIKESKIGILDKESFEGFLKGEVVINCDTEDKAKTLMAMCDIYGVTWSDDEKASENSVYNCHKENTCYRVDDSDGCLVYGGLGWYKKGSRKIVKM